MSIEIVSVTYRFGKAGQREPWHFEDYGINRPDPDNWSEDIQGYDWNDQPIPTAHIQNERLGGVYIDLPTDWFGLSFGFPGQLFERQIHPLSHEVENVGAVDAFGDWADDLRAIGDRLIAEEIERRKSDWNYRNEEKEIREVTFLTAWRFMVSRSYEGDVDVDWELLGLIDLSKIETLIAKEAQHG
jgi:hypothetical protein